MNTPDQPFYAETAPTRLTESIDLTFHLSGHPVILDRMSGNKVAGQCEITQVRVDVRRSFIDGKLEGLRGLHVFTYLDGYWMVGVAPQVRGTQYRLDLDVKSRALLEVIVSELAPHVYEAVITARGGVPTAESRDLASHVRNVFIAHRGRPE
jgi:hypothetical protein